jgi:hypothetical protein
VDAGEVVVVTEVTVNTAGITRLKYDRGWINLNRCVKMIHYHKSPDIDDKDTILVATSTRVAAVSQTDDWIEVEGGRWLPKKLLKPARRHLTTSDFIKAHIQPVTLPPGWLVEPEVTNSANSWYTHHYINLQTGERRSQHPPPGTYSLCAKMAADPETAHYIGTPTHFLSHAHTMSFLETLCSIEAYATKLPEEEVAKMYWWIDGFAIDQHECQYAPPSIDDNSVAWAAIFQAAIGKMGNVVMVLNPVSSLLSSLNNVCVAECVLSRRLAWPPAVARPAGAVAALVPVGAALCGCDRLDLRHLPKSGAGAGLLPEAARGLRQVGDAGPLQN